VNIHVLWAVLGVKVIVIDQGDNSSERGTLL